MARIARVVVPGMPHHVTQRGNRRMPTFFCDEDYGAYLSLLAAWCSRWRVRIWAYCLMPNHVHLIVVPDGEQGLCGAIGEAHRRYTRRVNFREGWRGHLWQGRFASFVMDDAYLLSAARHVERNPVRAGLVDRPEAWPWSSAPAHVSGGGDNVAEGGWLVTALSSWSVSWAEFLADADDALGEQLHKHAATGRPLGEPAFIDRVGRLLGRALVPKKRGPKPRKGN